MKTSTKTAKSDAAAPRPVTWFEIAEQNGARLRSFYDRLFGWKNVTLFVEVADLEGTLREAERLGGKTISGPKTFPDQQPSSLARGAVTFASFVDPEGHLVALCSGIAGPRETPVMACAKRGHLVGLCGAFHSRG